MKRKHVPLTTKLASALLLSNPDDREHAKSMSAEQYISLFQFDHVVLWAIDPNDHFTNLTPMLIAPHREKSRKDTSTVAKVKRLEIARAAHRAVLSGDTEFLKKLKPRPKSRIQSRPFNSKRRPLRGKSGSVA